MNAPTSNSQDENGNSLFLIGILFYLVENVIEKKYHQIGLDNSRLKMISIMLKHHVEVDYKLKNNYRTFPLQLAALEDSLFAKIQHYAVSYKKYDAKDFSKENQKNLKQDVRDLVKYINQTHDPIWKPSVVARVSDLANNHETCPSKI